MARIASWFRSLVGQRGEATWRLSLRSKFLLMMLLTSLTSLGCISYLAYRAGEAALTDAAVEKLTGLRTAKKQQIEYYFRTKRSNFAVVADAPMVARALGDFTDAFRQLDQTPLSAERRAALQAYYTSTFLPKLSKATGRPETVAAHMPTTTAAEALQSMFLVESPSGEPPRLPANLPYTQVHATYHQWFENVVSRFDLYDLFLVDGASGDIVYTVTKETDLGQNIHNGPIAGTNLGRLVREVAQTRRPGQVDLSRFSLYPPSLNVPSSFMAVPLFRDQKFIGAMVAQLSTKALAKFMHDDGKWRDLGLGETGEVFIVGADYLLRSDLREIVEKPDRFIARARPLGIVPPATVNLMEQQKSTILYWPIRRTSVTNALAGRKGHESLVNQLGDRVIDAYERLDIPGLEWVLIARMQESEILATQIQFNRKVIIAATIITLLTTLAALWLGRQFLQPVQSLLKGFDRLRKGDRSVVVEVTSRDEFADLTHAFNGMTADLKRRNEVIEDKSRAYEQLLKQIFPDAVADRLKQGDATIAESFTNVTTIYAVIDGFPAVAEVRDGATAIKLLNEIVDRFDAVAEAQGVEKVKTIGDHYLAVSGLSMARLDHARRALEFARQAWREIMAVNQANGLDLGLRIGIASGVTQAGIVGSRRFVYDVWGLAPSSARRIVYEADVNAVRMTAETYVQIADKSDIGEELVVTTKTMGRLTTHQLRFQPASQVKIAERAAE
jgi:class 3 adenylate cyclase